jgi:hypothetical protein
MPGVITGSHPDVLATEIQGTPEMAVLVARHTRDMQPVPGTVAYREKGRIPDR